MGDEQDAGKVVRFKDYVGRKRKKRQAEPAVMLPAMDEATKQLHAAASTAMLLVADAREQMGLPPL